MRKIYFERGEQPYSVDDRDIDKIIKQQGFDGPFNDENQKLAALGLMFL